jgi:hypothetical protein
MIAGDYYVTVYKGNDLNEIPMRVYLWLENMTRIDLGNYSADFSYAGSYLWLHLDHRDYPRVALFS